MLSENQREKQGPLFFLIGLSISILSVIILFQISTPVTEHQDRLPTEHMADLSLEMPITVMVPKKESAPKILHNLDPDPNLEPKVKLEIPLKLFGDGSEEGTEDPVEIGQETGLEDIEPVDIVLLEHIAVPSGCESLSTREEKVKCMNRWITEYVRSNLKYPEMARRMALSDKVYLSFVVSPSGEITEVEVKRGEYQVLNTEAIRVLENMPNWIPAQQFTHKVPMRMVIPFQFSAR